MSTSLTWTGALNTDLDNEENWSPSTAPTSSDTITFSTLSNGGTLTGSASAEEFAFNDQGPWVLNGATLTIAGEPGSGLPFAGSFNTNVTLTATTLNAAGGTTYIGDTGGATVTANSGSTVTTEGDDVGTNAGDIGSLVLTGSGTSWIEEESDVDGSGGSLTVGGADGSTGLVSVSNSASLVSQASAVLGEDLGSQGFGTVASGGVWQTQGSLVVGQGGSGMLTINSGGTLLSYGEQVFVGEQAGSTGELVINTGGTFDAATPIPQVFDIGDQAASGTLGAASGYVLVNGGSLDLSNNSPFGSDTLAVGVNGDGALLIENGGSVMTGGIWATRSVGSSSARAAEAPATLPSPVRALTSPTPGSSRSAAAALPRRAASARC